MPKKLNSSDLVVLILIQGGAATLREMAARSKLSIVTVSRALGRTRGSFFIQVGNGGRGGTLTRTLTAQGEELLATLTGRGAEAGDGV